MDRRRQTSSWASGTLLLIASFFMPLTAVSAAQTCSAAGMSATDVSAPGTTDPSEGSPTPQVSEIPATPNQGAIDAYIDNFAATGTLSSSPVATEFSADAATAGSPSSGMTSSEAQAVLDVVYRHRLTDSSDTIQALIARDSEVSQAYQTLVASGRLVTSADTDLTAALHHLSLLRNGGSQGGFSVGGNQVISIGVVPVPPISGCRMNPGGFINWANGRAFNSCMAHNFEEAMVFLTVVQPGGQVYRAVTTSNYCDPTRSAYGFVNVPVGTAEVIARPVRRCCQEGRLTYQLTCNPVSVVALACVPGRNNHMVTVNMGPWTPPGYYGQTTPGAHVWVADKENACNHIGDVVANGQGFFTLPSCLPSGDVYVYAESGGRIGRVNVSDSLPCGFFEGPLSIPIRDLPRVKGQILNWVPAWAPNAGGLAIGCASLGCNGSGSMVVTAPANVTTGAYQLQLKPGRWTLFSYHDLGTCTNSFGQSVQWRCLASKGFLDLEPGDVISPYDLPQPPAFCPCPP
jgi:hypothetical protein